MVMENLRDYKLEPPTYREPQYATCSHCKKEITTGFAFDFGGDWMHPGCYIESCLADGLVDPEEVVKLCDDRWCYAEDLLE